MAVVSSADLFAPLTFRKCLFLIAVGSLFGCFVFIFAVISRNNRLEKTCPLSAPKFFSYGKKDGQRVFHKDCYYFSNSSGSKSIITHRWLSGAQSTSDTYPRILHRTWNGNVPEKWLESDGKLDHGDYHLCVWSYREMKEFLAMEYPLFHQVYLRYQHSSQHAAATRYFVVYHFGGIYFDLDPDFDIQVDKLLNNFASFDIVLASANDSLENHFIISKPRQVFWRLVIDNLDDSNKWYGLPYATVSYSAGSMHLTICHDSYTALGSPNQGRGDRIVLVPVASLKSLVSELNMEESGRSISKTFAFHIIIWSLIVFLVSAVVVNHCLKDSIKLSEKGSTV